MTGIRSLKKHRKTNQNKYSNKTWFIAAGLVPFVFLAAQQIVLNIMIRLPSPPINLSAYVSLSWICGIVPFVLAFALIGLLQPIWRDPDLPKGTFSGLVKKEIPWILILFALWCSVLGSYSFLNTVF